MRLLVERFLLFLPAFCGTILLRLLLALIREFITKSYGRPLLITGKLSAVRCTLLLFQYGSAKIDITWAGGILLSFKKRAPKCLKFPIQSGIDVRLLSFNFNVSKFGKLIHIPSISI